ncbi:response regulator transcription factor [Streptomyces albus subsp. chlorinus]|nr:response regulator transcription factor [Streptomyces albus subsp. chlorinus]
MPEGGGMSRSGAGADAATVPRGQRNGQGSGRRDSQADGQRDDQRDRQRNGQRDGQRDDQPGWQRDRQQDVSRGRSNGRRRVGNEGCEPVRRVRGVCERSGARAPLLVVGDLTMDEETREVRRAGAVIRLTATEFELLRYLMRNPRRVLSKAQILERVWDYDVSRHVNLVELYVSYLRRKIDAGRAPMIRTRRGAGYVLTAAGAEDTAGAAGTAAAADTVEAADTAEAAGAVDAGGADGTRGRCGCQGGGGRER